MYNTYTMVSVFFYFLVSYLLCAYQFETLSSFLKIPHNVFGRIEIKFLKLVRKKYQFFSFNKVFRFIDNAKCFLCVLLSMVIFEKKEVHDITAIISYFSYCFPIFYHFKNNNKNFLSVIFTCFLLDKITGISMLVAFLVSLKKSGYMSLSIVSCMIVGILKTSFHILLFGNTDYFEMVFIMCIGCIALYDNSRLVYNLFLKSQRYEKKYLNFELFNKIHCEYTKLCAKYKKNIAKEKHNIKNSIKEFNKIFIKNDSDKAIIPKYIKKIKTRFDTKYKKRKQEYYKKGFEKCKQYFFKAKEKNKDNKYYKIKKCGETRNNNVIL